MRAFPALQPRVFVCGRVCVCGGPAGELFCGELGGAFGACLPQCGKEFSQSSNQKCTGFMGHSGHCLTANTLKNIHRYSRFSFFIVFTDTYTLNDTIDQFCISGSKHTSPHYTSFRLI